MRQRRARLRQVDRLLLPCGDFAAQLGMAVGQALLLGLQCQPRLTDRQLGPVDLLLELRVAQQPGIPRAVIGASALERSPTGLDLVALAQHGLDLRQPSLGGLKLLPARAQLLLGAAQAVAQIGELVRLRSQPLDLRPAARLLGFRQPQRIDRGQRGRARRAELRLVVGAARQVALDRLDLPLDQPRPLLARLGLRFRALLVEIIAAQAEDIGQDLLALAGRLDGEGIGAALEEEGGVGEGVVVEPQRADDLRLPFEQAAVVQHLPVAIFTS